MRDMVDVLAPVLLLFGFPFLVFFLSLLFCFLRFFCTVAFSHLFVFS